MHDKMIIIYGYNSAGEAVYNECKRRNLKVNGYCDDSQIRRKLCEDNGFTAMSFEQLVEEKSAYKVIISIANYREVTKKLEDNNINNWVLASEFLEKELYKTYRYKIKSNDIAIREVEACILEQAYGNEKEKIWLRNIDLVVTERCSLRCRDCCNLMQYYQKPVNYSLDSILEELNDLLSIVDGITDVRILGGEPFMHTQLKEIVEKVQAIPEVRYVNFYTNATIRPSDEFLSILDKKKVGFSITDYNELSKNLHSMVEVLEKYGIPYDVHDAGEWIPCGDIIKCNRDTDSLKRLYDECCRKNLITLINGYLYKCPFIANGVNLKAIPAFKGDRIDVKELKKEKKPDAVRMLKEFLAKDYYEGCDYCMGSPYNAVAIEAAIQISEPRKYSML